LFAENPTDGVYHVGLAAAVGADDTGGAGTAESHNGAFTERLKTGDFDSAEFKQDIPFGL
jgi:hypothetical protein